MESQLEESGTPGRMPSLVKLILAALLIVGLPAGLVIANEARDSLWPWARMPAHVVIHVQNDSPEAITLRYGADTWDKLYPPWNSSPLASGEELHDTLMLPAGGTKPVLIEFEIALGASSVPLVQHIAVVPDEHLLYTIDSRGAVTLTRGHESRVGFPIFGGTAAVVGDAP